jgi:hypothetical protein
MSEDEPVNSCSLFKTDQFSHYFLAARSTLTVSDHPARPFCRTTQPRDVRARDVATYGDFNPGSTTVRGASASRTFIKELWTSRWPL